MFKKIYKTIGMSYITYKYILKLKKIENEEYKKLNDIKLDFTNELLKFLNIEYETKLEENRKNFDDEGNLFIVNHRSLLDIIIVENALNPLKVKNDVNNFWIAKRELSKIPIFGKFFTEVKSNIFIERESTSSTKKMLRDIKEKVKIGKCNVIIFPEGTRNKGEEDLLPFKKGSEMISKMNKLKVIPIYIDDNNYKTFNESPHKKTKKVTITFGEPIDDIKNLEKEYIKFKDKVKKNK